MKGKKKRNYKQESTQATKQARRYEGMEDMANMADTFEQDANMQDMDAVDAQGAEDAEEKQEMRKVITTEEIQAARDVYMKYKAGKMNLEKRIIENEDFYKLNHWKTFEKQRTNTNAIKSTSAWLFNSINNKHADFMDNFPAPNVLPKEQGDEESAKVLTSILPVILESCDFEQTYSDNATEKLKNGCGIYGIFFNGRKNKGIGDVDIKPVDILNIFWEPGKEDIQDSKNVFVLSLMDNDTLKAMYPELKDELGKGGDVMTSKYHYDDHVDTSEKSTVFDWYYKKYNGAREVLHYVKFVGDTVLYASEDDEEYKESGFYHHGKYPFVFDTLFKEKGTPSGFGYIDIMKSPQEYIDKLNQAILENAQWACRPRHFIRDNAEINESEFSDLNKDFVHVTGTGGNIGDVVKGIDTIQLNGNYLSVLQMKIDELKETSGNRDFSQGATTGGITAASAIAALQEAGSKTSRDMIKASYRSFVHICTMVIELIRQFYDEVRVFRIVGEDGRTEYQEFNNSILKAGNGETRFGVELSEAEPNFDIKVKAQKNSPYAREAQNELAIQLYQLGFFNPEIAPQSLAVLEMMEFEGKEKVKELIQGNFNSMLMQQQAAMQMQAQAMHITDPMREDFQSTPSGEYALPDEESTLDRVREQTLNTTSAR